MPGLSEYILKTFFLCFQIITWGYSDEENLSAQQDTPRPYPWLSFPYADPGRAQSDCLTACQGKGKIGALTSTNEAGCSFPRHLRLLKAEQYEYVFDKPQVSADRFFTILTRPNEIIHARLGLAISKRRIGKAVARNRIKRLVRESFRLHRNQLPAADIVVMARNTAATADRKELWDSLERHWQQLIAASKSS